MCGAPQSAFARLISPISVHSSAEIFGLPTWLRDRQRQYARNPARCQRMIVSGLTVAIAPRTEGNQREPNKQKTIGIVEMRSPRRPPAKHIDLLPQDQDFCCQLCSRLEERSQDVENQIEQIGHQAANLPRPLPASMPNLIFGTHTHSKEMPLLSGEQSILRSDLL